MYVRETSSITAIHIKKYTRILKLYEYSFPKNTKLTLKINNLYIISTPHIYFTSKQNNVQYAVSWEEGQPYLDRKAHENCTYELKKTRCYICINILYSGNVIKYE
jgi:hypothetical protein